MIMAVHIMIACRNRNDARCTMHDARCTMHDARCTMHVSRFRSLSLEIFKALSNLNLFFMKDIFHIRTFNYSSRNPNNLIHHRPNHVTFGTNSLRFLGPQIWNCLLEKLNWQHLSGKHCQS